MAINFDKAALIWDLQWDADWVTAVSFYGSGRRVAAGNNLGQILAWELPEKNDAPAPAPLLSLQGHTNVISRLLPTPDGKSLISCAYDHTIRVWDASATGGASATVALNSRTREDLIRRRSSKVPDLVEVSVKTQQAARVIADHQEWVSDMKLTPDGKLLVSGDDAGQVIVRDFESGKELRRWSTPAWVYAVAVSPEPNSCWMRSSAVIDSWPGMDIELDVSPPRVKAPTPEPISTSSQPVAASVPVRTRGFSFRKCGPGSTSRPGKGGSMP